MHTDHADSSAVPGHEEQFDVAISYAGEDRAHAEAIAAGLRRAGVRVYYDVYEQGKLWGSNLYEHLSDVYGRRARYCVMLLSQSYATKLWTNHERQAAQARAFTKRGRAYILPVRIDATVIPGIPETVGYLPISLGPDRIVSILCEKLEAERRKSEAPRATSLLRPTWLRPSPWLTIGISAAVLVAAGTALWAMSSFANTDGAARSTRGYRHAPRPPTVEQRAAATTSVEAIDESEVKSAAPKTSAAGSGSRNASKTRAVQPSVPEGSTVDPSLPDLAGVLGEATRQLDDALGEVLENSAREIAEQRAAEQAAKREKDRAKTTAAR